MPAAQQESEIGCGRSSIIEASILYTVMGGVATSSMSGATTSQTKLVSLRLSHQALGLLKKRADDEGVGWQTFLKNHIYEWLGLNVDFIPPGTIELPEQPPVRSTAKLDYIEPNNFNPQKALGRLKGTKST